MLQYLLESFVVGIYSLFLFLFLSYSLSYGLSHKKFTTLNILFITGFLKHFMGYFLSLHKYYCVNICNKKKTNTTFFNLMIESIFEGVAFVIIGYLLSFVFTNKYILVFSIGFLLHIVSELLGFHKYYCNNRCKT